MKHDATPQMMPPDYCTLAASSPGMQVNAAITYANRKPGSGAGRLGLVTCGWPVLHDTDGQLACTLRSRRVTIMVRRKLQVRFTGERRRSWRSCVDREGALRSGDGLSGMT
jgi:hypothetical protein